MNLFSVWFPALLGDVFVLYSTKKLQLMSTLLSSLDPLERCVSTRKRKFMSLRTESVLLLHDNSHFLFRAHCFVFFLLRVIFSVSAVPFCEVYWSASTSWHRQIVSCLRKPNVCLSMGVILPNSLVWLDFHKGNKMKCLYLGLNASYLKLLDWSKWNLVFWGGMLNVLEQIYSSFVSAPYNHSYYMRNSINTALTFSRLICSHSLPIDVVVYLFFHLLCVLLFVTKATWRTLQTLEDIQRYAGFIWPCIMMW
jgi:hypothetical protein